MQMDIKDIDCINNINQYEIYVHNQQKLDNDNPSENCVL